MRRADDENSRLTGCLYDLGRDNQAARDHDGAHFGVDRAGLNIFAVANKKNGLFDAILCRLTGVWRTFPNSSRRP